LAALAKRLQPVSETASLDVQLLLAHILGVTRAWVLAHPEVILSTQQLSELEAGALRLEAGEPLPYLLGHWEFFGLDFIVTPAVLIPRPETELMVEQALDWLRWRYTAGEVSACRAVDVGCGSGCVAIALAANTPGLPRATSRGLSRATSRGLHVTAADLSPQALEVARRNVDRHGLAGRVTLVQADLLPQQPPIFDLICANLPYIPTGKLDDLPVARWEPRSALDGGPDGLALIRRLLQQAAGRLAKGSPAPVFGPGGGLLLLEIESSLGAAAGLLARQAFSQWEEQGWQVQVEVLADLAGLDRLVRVEISL
jgi:release factor glutamine methyltransferase